VSGKLYVVAVPIGNPRDISLRAVDLLAAVDLVVCETTKETGRLLKGLGIRAKELVELNEHNEEEQARTVLARLSAGQAAALVSDAGTPVFYDPGTALIALAAETQIPVVPVPGPSSLMAALSVLDFAPRQFFFAGFPPRESNARRAALRQYHRQRLAVVLMDAPYRMGALLADVAREWGVDWQVTLAADLTLPSEVIYRGPVGGVAQRVKGQKAEFVLVIHPPVS
jgi:16S rRNA (cytidine1402-2'-O)-methyltransferase